MGCVPPLCKDGRPHQTNLTTLELGDQFQVMVFTGDTMMKWSEHWPAFTSCQWETGPAGVGNENRWGK